MRHFISSQDILTTSSSSWIAALYHEVRNDTVEYGTIEIIARCQRAEILACLRLEGDTHD